MFGIYANMLEKSRSKIKSPSATFIRVTKNKTKKISFPFFKKTKRIVKFPQSCEKKFPYYSDFALWRLLPFYFLIVCNKIMVKISFLIYEKNRTENLLSKPRFYEKLLLIALRIPTTSFKLETKSTPRFLLTWKKVQKKQS